MESARALVTIENIRRARDVIGPRLHRTPIMRSEWLSRVCGSTAVLKLELFQKTGSFKPRGVLNALSKLTSEERSRGVITLSAGNHAQAVAWAAASLGIKSTVVMPSRAVQTKVDATRTYGGEVILTEGDLLATTLELQRQRDLVLIHPFDDLNVIAGQGTVALELLEDVPETNVVIVGCGGGGLLAGVAATVKALRPEARVYGVEPAGAAGMRQSLDSGHPVKLERVDTIADGLSAPFIGVHTYEHALQLVDDVLVVNDSEILAAMKGLMQRCKVLAEPAGAAALVPLLTNRLTLEADTTVAVVISGGNLDLDRLKTLL